MNKKEEKTARTKENERMNCVTQKSEPENQNQTHNVRREGIQPVNQKR